MDAPVKETIVLTVRLTGEAAMRLQMWAEQKHMTKNLAGRELLIDAMIEKGLLLKSYREI